MKLVTAEYRVKTLLNVQTCAPSLNRCASIIIVMIPQEVGRIEKNKYDIVAGFVSPISA